jgi:hypothetical protein
MFRVGPAPPAFPAELTGELKLKWFCYTCVWGCGTFDKGFSTLLWEEFVSCACPVVYACIKLECEPCVFY